MSQYVVFVDPHQGNNDVMPFSLPTTKVYVEFIGREKARALLAFLSDIAKDRHKDYPRQRLQKCLLVFLSDITKDMHKEYP